MSGSASFCFEAGKALLRALDAHERGSDPTRLLDGEVTEVEARWACSAIKLKEDAGWLVVPKTEPVQFAESGRRVRAFDSGKYGGRSKHYDMTWLAANADAVSLGSLTLAEGAGAHSSFSGGAGGAITVVAAGDSTDGKYYVMVAQDGSEDKVELGAALLQVGAEMTAFGGAAAVEDETDVVASLRGEGATVAKVRKGVALLGELGCKTA